MEFLDNINKLKAEPLNPKEDKYKYYTLRHKISHLNNSMQLDDEENGFYCNPHRNAFIQVDYNYDIEPYKVIIKNKKK